MAEERRTWFDLKLLAGVADVVLKISAALGILLGVFLHLFRANVVLASEAAVPAELPGQCPKAEAYARSPHTNPFFQAELAPTVVRDEYAKLGRPVPVAVDVLVDGYNQDNECDLKAMKDSTEATTPISQLCGPWSAASEAAFGAGFCAGGGPASPSARRLRYWGRTYERRLIEANEAGRNGLEPMRLPADQLASTLDILHRAEFGAGRVEVTNTGRAVATDVRLHAPPGYSFVGSDDDTFDLQSKRTAVRRLETDRGIRPQTIDRRVGVQWNTGRGYVPGGKATVLVTAALVVLAIVAAVWTERSSFRRARAAPAETPASGEGRPGR